MYRIETPAVYVNRCIEDDPACMERMGRMMACIRADKVETVGDQQLLELGLRSDVRGESHGPFRSTHADMTDPIVIFDRHDWAGEHTGWVGKRDTEDLLRREGVVCQNGFGLRLASGCLHKCAYCERTTWIRIFLTVEDLLDRLDAHIQEMPSWKHYFADGDTDLMCLEPEYGASELLIRYFAEQNGRYLHLTTKSDNVDHLLDLEHKGKTILSWTLSPERMSRAIERGVPCLDRRLEAMRKCHQAGYLVRCRFSPIIPLRDWQADYRAMIARLFQTVTPQAITLWTFSHTDLANIGLMFDPDMLEEEYLAAATAGADQMRGLRSSPFPPETRARIYRFIIDEVRRVDAHVPVSLCLETADMWERLSPHLDMTKDRYFCNCGEDCVPGTHLYREFVGRTTSQP